MQEPQRACIKRTLDHMSEHDGNIKYDKYTGEIKYDGVKAPDSDVRLLLSTLTSTKKRPTAPKGSNLFMCSLNDTDAPADIHLGWKWNKSPGSYGRVELLYSEAKQKLKRAYNKLRNGYQKSCPIHSQDIFSK